MDTILTHLFVLSIPILEKIIRPILVYFFLIVGLRLAGKREMAQLNPFDLVVLLTLSNTVQNAIIGDDNTLLGGVIGATTLLIVNYLMVNFIHHNKKVEKIIEGEPDKLIENGKVIEKALEKNGFDLIELEIAARRQGFIKLEDVEDAFLETDGSISFIRHEPEPEELRHRELLARLDALERQIAELKPGLTP